MSHTGALAASWSSAVRVMPRPVAAYRELALQPAGHGPIACLRRPVLAALLLGATVSLTTSGRLTLRLVLGGATSWSFVPLLQMATATVVAIVLARGRVSLPRALDLYFMGHGPWSLWLLGVAGLGALVPGVPSNMWLIQPTPLLVLSLAVAFVWSNALTFGFLRGGLGLSLPASWAGLLLHVVILWGSVFAFFLLSGQLLPRIQGELLI